MSLYVFAKAVNSFHTLLPNNEDSINTHMKRICVLIPAYNEQIVISSTIKSLIECGFNPHDIFIVDDCSTDGTFAEAKKYIDNVISMPSNSGKARAQTHAIDHFKLTSRYDYVAMMDCDSQVGHDFKKILQRHTYDYPSVDLFVGQVKNAKSNNLISALRAVEYTFSHNIVKKGQHNFGVIYVAPGCASVYSSRMLEKLVFDPDILAEDMDLTLQVHALGGKIRYLHGAEVTTQDPQTIADYNKQVMRWFRGFWQVVNKYNILKLGLRKKVSLYMLYIILDTLIANRIVTAFVSAFFLPLYVVLIGVLIDFSIFFGLTVYAAVKTKRYNICLKSPLLYLLLFFNAFAFIKSFFEVIILRKKNFGWNKVARYTGEEDEKATSSSSATVHTRTG